MELKELLNDGLGERERIYTINVEITGLCNSHCTYCHFYLKHDRKSVAYHMADEQFEVYCNFVKYWNEHSGGITNFRFSGGDPITLKEKLFIRANQAFEISGVRPFLLTHGRKLKAEWFEQARESALQSVYFSVENPIAPDPGAERPETTLNYVMSEDTDEMPVRLGVCVVPNAQFENLLDICDWFYDRVGYIPAIAEVNYGAYQSPTEEEWLSLKRALPRVIEKYADKAHLNLFHSVSPELSYSGADPYVFILGLINRFGIDRSNIAEKTLELAADIRGPNYPDLHCSQDCNWSDFCQNTKWYWQGDDNNSRAIKLRDYCKFKRTLNDSYYQVMVDSSHLETECQISV